MSPETGFRNPESGSAETFSDRQHPEFFLDAFEPVNPPETDKVDPEAIKQLEDTDMFLQDKVEMLLAALGEKPVTYLPIASPEWKEGEDVQYVSDEEYEQYTGLAAGLGLRGHVFEHMSTFEDGASQIKREIIVSRREDVLELYDTVSGMETDLDRQVAGFLFGYPPTAVDAYINGQGVSAKKTGDYSPETLAFAWFKVSPDNAAADVAVMHRWAQAIKQASPKLYAETLEFAKQDIPVYPPSGPPSGESPK
jgi:hypothetical protein